MEIGDTFTIATGDGTTLTGVVISGGGGGGGSRLDPKAQAMDRAVSALQRQHKSDGMPSRFRPTLE